MVIKPKAGGVKKVLGSQYRFLGTRAAFTLLEGTVRQQTGVPLDLHQREDETFFVLEGRMEIQCAGQTHVLGPKGTAFLPRNLAHSYSNPDTVPAKYLVFITPGGFEKCLVEFSQLPKGPPPAPEALVEIGRKYGLEFLPA